MIGAGGIVQSAIRNQRPFGHVALTDNHLPGVGSDIIGLVVEVSNYAVHLQHLSDVSGDDTVVVTFLDIIGVVVIGTLVGQ